MASNPKSIDGDFEPNNKVALGRGEVLSPEKDDDDLDEDELDEDEDEDDDDFEDDDDDIELTAESKKSAQKLLELLAQQKALALVRQPGVELIEGIARALESLGNLKSRTTKMVDVIVESDDVDELFIDDETLSEIIKRW